MRLSPDASLPASVARPDYDRESQNVGIVHIGIGAFHRAHQANYTDAAMNAGERDWMITGVSLRSPSVAEQLNPQAGLYTLTERSNAGDVTRLIGAIRNVLIGAQQGAAAIANPAVRIVSSTITEKGYCRAADGSLDPLLANESTLYPLLKMALRRRMEQNAPGVTLLCCDNLSDNGHQLHRLLTAYLDAHDRDLRKWVEDHCTFPCTMVDRIVPATSDADRDAVADAIGYRDAGAVITEPFSQWVIEDRFANGHPDWEGVGATFTHDVRPYEDAKLRMLNGAHSALAYLGLARGYRFVHEAICDPELKAAVEQIMRDEAAPTVATAAGQDLKAYATQILKRFANSALPHSLSQIATDGSQKIGQRWFQTLAAQQRMSKDCPALLAALGAWICHIKDEQRNNDPMAALFAGLWREHGTDGIVDALFSPRALGGIWNPSLADKAVLKTYLA